MTDSLFLPAITIYAFAPLIALIATGIQIFVFKKTWFHWVVLAMILAWGVFIALNIYHVVWLPYFFSAAFQDTYSIIRGSIVLVYLLVAILSIIRRTDGLKIASFALILVIIGDLALSHLAGRNVGP